MEFYDLSLKGLKLIAPRIHKDSRGYFLESFRESLFQDAGIELHFVQENHSYSKQNIVRGMHFQKGLKQTKLVRVASGRIYDVVVDIRPESHTFGCWQGVYLDDEAHKMLLIPPGFAHGFVALSESVHLVYKVDTYYTPETELGFRYDDPEINIAWPVSHPILSERDISLPSFRSCLKTAVGAAV